MATKSNPTGYHFQGGQRSIDKSAFTRPTAPRDSRATSPGLCLALLAAIRDIGERSRPDLPDRERLVDRHGQTLAGAHVERLNAHSSVVLVRWHRWAVCLRRDRTSPELCRSED